MRIGMVGLGRMGANMARRLAAGGVSIAAFDASAAARAALAGHPGIETVDDLAALVAALEQPRVVWLMLPSGDISQRTLDQLGACSPRATSLSTAPNAHYKDSMRHAQELAAHGVALVDAGVSGGIWGLENGYALMVGGEPRRSSGYCRWSGSSRPAPIAAGCIADRRAPGILSRWSTTGSNTE